MNFGANQSVRVPLLVCVTYSQVASTPIAGSRVGGLDRSTFAEFYTASYRDLTAYCWQLVRDADAAREMAQECYARLLTRWVKVQDPRAYVFHIATNLARETWRAQAKAAAALDVLSAQPAPAPAADLGEALAVRAAVDSLPRRHREVVLLYYYADLPLNTVAAAVRRPAGTVKRQLSEARALLVASLEDSDD